jgi:hypothetical protein
MKIKTSFTRKMWAIGKAVRRILQDLQKELPPMLLKLFHKIERE